MEKHEHTLTVITLRYYWIHNNRLPKHTLNYKPRGRRDRGCPRKWWQPVDAGTSHSTQSLEEDDDDNNRISRNNQKDATL